MVANLLELCQRFILPCFYAFSACVGFTLIFNVHGKGKVICGLGGALGWLVYILVGETILGAFVAALSIGFYSEIMARLRHYPVTGYLLISLLSLVPGGGIYYAMRYCVLGDTMLFLSTLLYTFGVAAALAVGGILSSTLFRNVILRALPHKAG